MEKLRSIVHVTYYANHSISAFAVKNLNKKQIQKCLEGILENAISNVSRSGKSFGKCVLSDDQTEIAWRRNILIRKNVVVF